VQVTFKKSIKFLNSSVVFIFLLILSEVRGDKACETRNKIVSVTSTMTLVFVHFLLFLTSLSCKGLLKTDRYASFETVQYISNIWIAPFGLICT
jgi:hypothetical protein